MIKLRVPVRSRVGPWSLHPGVACSNFDFSPSSTPLILISCKYTHTRMTNGPHARFTCASRAELMPCLCICAFVTFLFSLPLYLGCRLIHLHSFVFTSTDDTNLLVPAHTKYLGAITSCRLLIAVRRRFPLDDVNAIADLP